MKDQAFRLFNLIIPRYEPLSSFLGLRFVLTDSLCILNVISSSWANRYTLPYYMKLLGQHVNWCG
jgi:hypothetical protein